MANESNWQNHVESVQRGSVSSTVNEKKDGIVHEPEDLDWGDNEESPGHDNDEAAVAGYCHGSRDTRETTDPAEKWAAEFEDF